MILLDTDVLIEIVDKHSSQGDIAIKKLTDIGENIAISSLTLHEIRYGLLKYGKKKPTRFRKTRDHPLFKRRRNPFSNTRS